MLIDGTKTHTIRKGRTGKSPHAGPGKPVYLYVGMRTKWCQKIGEGICTDTESIAIYESGAVHMESAGVLDTDQKNRLAWDDGFRPEGSTKDQPGEAFELMFQFWKQNNELPFIGRIIHWKLLSAIKDTTSSVHF